MNFNIHRLLPVVLAMTLLAGGKVGAQGTAFTYQGRLANNGQPASGSYDLVFNLYAASQAGGLLAGPATNVAVAVSNGLFTTVVDFGNVFAGGSNWLEIAVSTNGANSFSTLAPRQQLTPVPYAILANAASNVLGLVNVAQLTGSIPVSSVSGVLPLAQIPAVVVTNGASSITVSGAFNGNAGGLTNLNAGNFSSGTLADVRLSTNVALLNATNFFTGTNTFGGILKATNANNVLAGSFAGNAAGLTNLAFLNGTNAFAGSNIFAGVLKATNASNLIMGIFSGNGASLTNLSATNLVSGTISQGLLPVTVVTNNQSGVTLSGTFSGSGALLTNLNASYLTSGTIPQGQLPAAVLTNGVTGALVNGTVTGNGAGLTNLSANNLATGTVPQGLLPVAVVTNNQSGVTLSGTFGGDGSALINLNGSSVAGGTVADAWLSTNVVLLNGNQTFTGSPVFSGSVILTNSLNTLGGMVVGTFTGNGAGLTNLSAANLVSGTIAQSQLPATVVTNNQGNVTLTGTFSGGGAGLTNLNAGTIATGYLSDSRLSFNVPLLNGYQTFSGTNTFTGLTTLNNFLNVIKGSFTGNGAGLTNLPASSISSGSFGLGQLPTVVVTNGSTNVTLTGTISGIINGNGAGLTNITAGNFGNFNTAIGLQAFSANNVGTLNMAIGYSALMNSTNGSYNTASGAAALSANTSGSRNTGYGYSALGGNVSGTNNTAVGASALLSNVSGTNNTAVGNLAGSAITGNNNIDIGNAGVVAESGIIRIGDTNNQTAAYIAGINGTDLTAANPVYVDSNGKLGTGSGTTTHVITGTSSFAGTVNATNLNNTYNGTYNGNAANLTNINAANLASGTVSMSRLPSGLITNNATAATLAGQFTGYFYGNGAGLSNISVSLQGLIVGDKGNQNTSEGLGALLSTNGSKNTANGFAALANTNLAGSNNTADGYGALFNALGSSNTGVGALSGFYMTNGNYNIYIGNKAPGDESGVIRIGDPSLQNATYIAGINGADITTGQAVYVDANGKLGTNSAALNYNASKLSSGTLSDSLLSANVPLLNANQTFTGINQIHDTQTHHGFRITDGTTVGNINLQTCDGGNSGFQVINFNGYYDGGEARYNTSKNRWRIVVDDRNASDYFNIDTYNGTSITAVLALNTNGNVAVAGSLTASGSVYAGVGVFTNGVQLTSDRNAKENFVRVSTREVLEKVAAMPITEWNYKTGSTEIRHLGPMAQDFKASFGLNGPDDRHINIVDENGVALAAIQGLNEKLQDESKAKDAQIQELKARLEKLEQLLTSQKGAAQ